MVEKEDRYQNILQNGDKKNESTVELIPVTEICLCQGCL